MTDNVSIQGLEFQIEENSAGAVKGLNALSTSLEGLRKAVGSGIDSLDRVASSLSSFQGAVSKFKGLRLGTLSKNVGDLVSEIRKISPDDCASLKMLGDSLGSLSTLERPHLTGYINQLKRLPEVAEALKDIDTAALSQKFKELSAAMKPFADEMFKVSQGFASFPSRIQKLLGDTDQYNAAIEKSTKTTGRFAAAIRGIKFGAVVLVMRRVMSALGKAISRSNAYQENLNLFTVAMGEYSEEAMKYGEEVSKVLGIDLSDWIRNQGVFNVLLTGFGNTADRAAFMSKNLTQLGYDLSSFFNISVAEAMQKLQSGISGELEPLRRLGFDLSQARLEAEALDLGITKSVSAMTQAEKAELRYHAILTQVTDAQGDLARTLETPANQIRILQAQFAALTREIGNIFIPVANKVLPLAIAGLKVLREAANLLAKITGFELTEVDYSGIEAGAVAAGDLEEGLKGASSAAKKLKDYTAGFDELNVFNPDTGNTGRGGIGAPSGGAGFDFDLPGYDFLGNAQEKADSLVGIVKTVLSSIMNVLGGALLAVGAIFAFSGANVPLGIGLMLKGALALGAAAVIDWDSSLSPIENICKNLEFIVGSALLAVGAMLAFTGADLPLGIGLMAVGALALGSAAVLKWDSMPTKVKSVVSQISFWVGTAFLAVGAMLALSGANVMLGLALLAAGSIGVVTGIKLNWDGIKNSIRRALSGILGIVSGASIAVGAMLCLSGVGVGLGLAMLASGFAGSYAAWRLDDNPITRFVRRMANSIVDIINAVARGINDIFDIHFNGFDVAGYEIIRPFNVRLINIPMLDHFADGGFPDEGSLFVAREAGPEMVGNIGRKTAVANNQQIIEGIASGVSEANDGVIAAVYALIDAVDRKQMSVNIGDDTIGHSYDRYNDRRGTRVTEGAFANAY